MAVFGQRWMPGLDQTIWYVFQSRACRATQSVEEEIRPSPHVIIKSQFLTVQQTPCTYNIIVYFCWHLRLLCGVVGNFSCCCSYMIRSTDHWLLDQRIAVQTIGMQWYLHLQQCPQLRLQRLYKGRGSATGWHLWSLQGCVGRTWQHSEQPDRPIG